MKIAQVSPLIESVPPRGYGGTERVVSYLTEELVAQGHEVTLFASADSITRATLIPVIPESIRSSAREMSLTAYSTVQMGLVVELSTHFDIIHFHTGYMHFPIARQLNVAHVTTLHDRQDLPELTPVYEYYPQMPLVSISDNQRLPQPELNWVATVHHGLPGELYAFNPTPQQYFVFIGRISPDKRVDRAIEIAEFCGITLYIGAVVEAKYQTYFETKIKPLFAKSCVRFLGEINQQQKRELLENALALLFPIDWPEPFGLVMIEALACGTPVIAYSNGATTEIVEHGVTGFLVSNQDEAIEAAKQICGIRRAQCRAVFEQRFTAHVMAENYLNVYKKLLARTTAP